MHEPIYWNSRDEFPDILNRLGLLGVGVEVGVERAHHACAIRRRWNGELLICVDKWAVNPTYAACDQSRHDSSKAEALRNIRGCDRPVDVIEAWSLEAVATVKERLPGGVDWVYLDADHSYGAVKADIAAWKPLIRPGGILAGHDFVLDGFHMPGEPLTAHEVSPGGMACPFGVRKAVTEAFGDNVSITSPLTDEGWQSWLVRV